MKLTLILVIVLGVMLAGTGIAVGDTFTFHPLIEGVWNDVENWRDSSGVPGIPTTDDTADIGTKRCAMESGTTEACKILIVNFGGRLVVEDDATLNLGDTSAATTSTMDGTLLFLKSGATCSCDPLSPPTPGTIHIVNDVTFRGTGTISGGCDDSEFSECRNPGQFTGAPSTLTLDTGSRVMTVNEYIHFGVPLTMVGLPPNIDNYVSFRVIVADQVMKFSGAVEGPGNFNFSQGTVQVDACMVLTGIHGIIDFADLADITDLPEFIVNGKTCIEGPFAIDAGTLWANADFVAMSSNWHFGATCVTDGGEITCSSQGDTVFEVAPGVVVKMLGTDGTCPACP